MLSQKPTRSRQRSKLISYRVDIADWQLLHSIAGDGGVQAVLDGVFQPALELLRRLKKQDEDCDGR